MKFRVEYYVVDPNDDDGDNDTKRLDSDKDFNCTERALDAIQRLVTAFEDQPDPGFDPCIDQGGDDEWYELTLATTLFEDEEDAALPYLKKLLADAEAAVL
jgi:hypothetical protein